MLQQLGDIIGQYLRDYLFITPLIVLVLCECTKVLVEWIKTGNWHERLFHPGGMPSSHSAFVTSLLIIVWHKRGPHSIEFAIAFVFACLMWYDAMGSRRAIGEQAALLNKMQKLRKLTERLGHSFAEVCGGIAFGAVVTAFGIWIS